MGARRLAGVRASSRMHGTFKALETKLRATVLSLGFGIVLPPGGGVLGPIFVGYVPLVSQNPYPIIVIFYGQL